MKKILLAFLIVLVFAVNAFAADYYIAQTAAGSGDASSCANAKIYSWNWTSPTVNDGDTVHLCGTITSTLTIPKSGTSAGITVKFETGANLTSTAWGTTSGAAIYASGKSYIIIDGGTNGVIANTNNGSSLGLQQNSTGISVVSGTHWEVKNLTIQNMYIHVYGGTNSYLADGFLLTDTSYVNIHNNTINNCYYGAFIDTGSSSISHITVASNNISLTDCPVAVALGAGYGIDTVSINNNTFTFGNNWYESGGGNHLEIIHVWGTASTHDAMTNLAIYNNTVSGDPTPINTGGFYLEDQIVSALIYNNVINVNNNHLANGFVYEKAEPNYGCTGVGTPWACCTGSTTGTCTTPGPLIMNNTFQNTAGGVCLEIIGTNGTIIENNIIVGTQYGTNDGTTDTTSTLTSDYNDYYISCTSGGICFAMSGTNITYAAWLALGFDAHSIITNPPLNSNLTPKQTIGTGVNLSAYFTHDILGNVISTWDMGAYNYAADQGGTSYTLSVTTSHGNVISGDGYINCTDNASHGGGACSYNYASGSITLTASADGSYTFTGWSGGGCSGVGTCTVTMNTSQSVTASYSIASVTPPSVTISTPSQTIPSNSLAISGTATQGTNPISSCAWSIGTPLSGTNAGTALTGTTSWSSSSNITSFSAGANTLYVGCVDNAGYWGNSSIVVTYTQVYNLSAVTTHGAVTSSPAGISCTDNGGTCNYSFISESVTFTESPDNNWTFSSWTVSGVPIVSGCTTGSTCVVTTNAIGTVTANYTGTPWNVTVSQASLGPGNGGVLNNLGVNSVIGDGSHNLVVTATPFNGWQILSASWGGDGVTPFCGGSGTTTFTSSAVTQDCSIKGTFTAIPILPWH